MRAVVQFSIVVFVTAYGAYASADTFGVLNQFNIDFVTVGSPGNSADTTGHPNPAGRVDYAYRIGKFEISEDMINKANTAGGLGITHDNRGTNKPATSISWIEAAKFVNWLNTSTGSSPAYKFDSSGNYQIWQSSDLGYDANNLFRNSLATYFLPSTDEWYKAAYYDPSGNLYYNYSTGSNIAPDGIDFSGDTLFDVVGRDGPLSFGPHDITNVGSLSPFGTAGQGGNVSEWEETGPFAASPLRSVRGGAWAYNVGNTSALTRNYGTLAYEHSTYGFRVASVTGIPEPSFTLFGMSTSFGLILRRRRSS